MKILNAILSICALVVVIGPCFLLADFVHGYVRDIETDQPIPNAHVDGQIQLTAHQFHVTTDSNGYYVVPDTMLPSGTWQIIASHQFYFSQTRYENLPTHTSIDFNLTPR